MSGREHDSRSRLPVAIALGSNLGDRRRHLEYAINALARELTNLKESTFIETEPAGVRPGQPAYLNAAVVGTTNLSPRALLDRLLEIEKKRGRERPYTMAPRTLDLDLILYGARIVEEEGLSIPHPRFREREFVLRPLTEIAPELIDPVSGQTVAQLLVRLKADPTSQRYS
jgi:2-amino-4-hydroxy-6-hydroxymethyldihydropteridine diphosphokinase